MSDPATFLAALQLGDSAFPSGMFTQSHGLERLIHAGLRGAALETVLHSYIRHSAGPAEALAARWTVRAAVAGDLALIEQIDERLDATKLAEEPRLASRRCGGRVAQLGVQLFNTPLLSAYARQISAGETPGHQSVALALLAHANGLDEHAATLVELQTVAASLASAALRLGAIDHVGLQRLLLLLRPTLIEAAEASADADWRDIGGFAPQIEIAQMQHRYEAMHLFVS